MGDFWIAMPALVLSLGMAAFCITSYRTLWQNYLQMKEPFTRWWSRIAARFPRAWWAMNGFFALADFVIGAFAPAWYWRALGVLYFGFMCWFIPHIVAYVLDHSEDNPPVGFGWWANLFRRIK